MSDMDGNIGDKLQELLKDPETIKTAMSIVSALGKKDDSKINEVEVLSDSVEPNDESVSQLPIKPVEILKTPREDDRIRLLRSLKPFLNSGKQKKVDSLVMALGAANLISSYKNDDMIKQLSQLLGL